MIDETLFSMSLLERLGVGLLCALFFMVGFAVVSALIELWAWVWGHRNG